MMDADPYVLVRAMLNKFPTDENAKNFMEERDIAIEKMHGELVAIVDQLNDLKPSFKVQIDTNAGEKERLVNTIRDLEKDIQIKESHLKKKELELEDLQQLSEVRRSIIEEQKRQFEILKAAEIANKENWTNSARNGH